MLRHYKRDSNHGALFARQNKPRVPNWNLILTRPASGAKRCSTTRDNIAKVAPHSCRFGAGYKSNERPTTGRLRATFLYEVNRARNYHANRAHTRGARVASRRLRP